MFKRDGSFVVFALFLIVCWDRTSSECTPLTACSCVIEDGTIYDLNVLSTLGLLNATENNNTYYFQPCKNVPMFVGNTTLPNECGGQGVTLCANITAEKKLASLGTVQETRVTLMSVPSNAGTALTIQHGTITSVIDLLCCPHCKTDFRVDLPRIENHYHFVLTSPIICDVVQHAKGLSTGSILVILLFVFSGLYFMVGALVLKFTRGATGWEMLPNHDFWCELPSLVRDGIVFTFSFNRADSYQRI